MPYVQYHTVQIVSERVLETEELLQACIEALQKRLDNEYNCPKLRTAINNLFPII